MHLTLTQPYHQEVLIRGISINSGLDPLTILLHTIMLVHRTLPPSCPTAVCRYTMKTEDLLYWN